MPKTPCKILFLIWNAARFCQMNDCKMPPDFKIESAELTVNLWIISKLGESVKLVAAALDNYRFNDAANICYQFVWNSFCDWYLELAKPILQGEAGKNLDETRAVSAWVFQQILHILHPFMPFIPKNYGKNSVILKV